MALSTQLSEISKEIGDNTQKQKAQQQGANALQVQQALSTPSQPGTGAAGTVKAGQQLAGAATQAQGQASMQAAQSSSQQNLAAAKTALESATAKEQQNIESKGLANEAEIAQMQKEGKLRQNSAELDAAKQIQEQELSANKYMSDMGMQFDNKLSFMTRKQREDLNKIGSMAKQQLFDSRMQFEGDEQNRKFSNARQLADYAVASAESDQALQGKLNDMNSAFEMEMIALDKANQLLTEKLELEFKRAEQTKDFALATELAKLKASVEAKMRRKAARAAANTAIIKGVATIGGAVAGTFAGGQTALGASAGATLGAQLGSAVGGTAAAQTQ